MLKYFSLFAGGLGLVLALTPLVRCLAIRLRVLDMPDERKVHRKPMPRWGGLGVFAAFFLVILLAFSPLAPIRYSFLVVDKFWWTRFFAGAFIIVVLGALDDVRPLGAKLKLLIQFIAAGVVVVGTEYTFDEIGLPWKGQMELGWLEIPVSLLWIVGLTNAFNLIDGLDGLATGIGVISSLTLAVVGLLNQSVELACLGFILAGCLLGFLRYNFRPASIFLGDSGSLFIGFTLAVMSIKTAHKGTVAVSVAVPLLACGLPVMEILFSFSRRILRALHVWEAGASGANRFFFLGSKAVMRADREHIHHRLLKMGITHRQCVLLLYAVCIGMALLALAASTMRNLGTGLVLVAMGGGAVMAVRKLRYEELELLGSGTFLPFVQQPWMGRQSVQVFADLCLIPLAYYLSYLTHFGTEFVGPIKTSFINTLPVVLLIKLAVLYVSRVYRIKWSHASIGDAIRVQGALVVASVLVFGVFTYLPVGACGRRMLVDDLMVVSVLLMGSRFSIRWLESFRRNYPTTCRRALIYGAGKGANLLVRELADNPKHEVVPMGFIDDDDSMRRKTFQGYPILGTCNDLLGLLRKHEVQEVIIATDKLDDEKLNKVKECCCQAGVPVKQFRVHLELLS